MQTVSSQYPHKVNQQTHKVAVIAILLFALSGLISGFAVGAFVHPKSQTGAGTGNGTTGSVKTPIVHATHTTVPTTTAEHINLALRLARLPGVIQSLNQLILGRTVLSCLRIGKAIVLIGAGFKS